MSDLYDKPVSYWYDRLTTDDDGEFTGHLRAPCSRYGVDGADCAWFAIAAEFVTVDANGPSDDPWASLDHLMSLAVNDHDGIATLLADSRHAVPDDVWEMLGDGWGYEDPAKQTALRKRVGIERDDPWPSHAWPGGYPIAYLTDDGAWLCGTCMNEQSNVHFDGYFDGWRIDAVDVLYEPEHGETCAHCNRTILEADDGP